MLSSLNTHTPLLIWQSDIYSKVIVHQCLDGAKDYSVKKLETSKYSKAALSTWVDTRLKQQEKCSQHTAANLSYSAKRKLTDSKKIRCWASFFHSERPSFGVLHLYKFFIFLHLNALLWDVLVSKTLLFTFLGFATIISAASIWTTILSGTF